MHPQAVSAGTLLRKKTTTFSQQSPFLSSYQMGKESSQPGKCINQDLQDPNQIKPMITTEAGREGACTPRRNMVLQDLKTIGPKYDVIRRATERN
jgi:hypothetical protein